MVTHPYMTFDLTFLGTNKCASTQGSSVPSLNKIDAEIKKLARFKQTSTQKWCTWPYSTWPFDPYMTFDLTLLGTIYVQVPKDHLYQV